MSAQDVAIPIATTRRDGDDLLAVQVAMMRDGEAAVDALFDVHNFQNVGELFQGDVTHDDSLKMKRLATRSR